MRRLFTFMLAVWKTNLASAMEYRAAFLTQVIGMFLNNAIYFVFWIIFFDRFKEIRGWGLDEMVLMFAVVAAGFGLAAYFFGNMYNIADIIAKGQLDYYLSLPQPVLMHTLVSRANASGMGDFSYGVLTFLVFGNPGLDTILRFVLGTLASMLTILAFMVLVQSLAFWLGQTQVLSQQATNAMITFALYPINLFEGGGRFVLFTIIPAAFIGAVPAEYVMSASWESLGLMLLGSGFFVMLGTVTFYAGLRRYESGSAINVQM